MRYRSRIDIISQILEAANGGNATRSKITYKAFLNYNQLKENLTALTEKDFATTKILKRSRPLKKVYDFLIPTIG